LWQARYWADRIVTGDEADLGPKDQRNFDELMRYAEQHAGDVDWINLREQQFAVAEAQLLRSLPSEIVLP
jgi:hypothetical protein